MERKVKDVVVRHPVYGETTVKAVHNNGEAVTEAARRWKAQWSVVARESTFETVGATNGPTESGDQDERGGAG